MKSKSIVAMGMVVVLFVALYPVESGICCGRQGQRSPSLSEGLGGGVQNHSFHGVTEGVNSNWYVIRLDSRERIQIEEIYVKIHSSRNVSEHWMTPIQKFCIFNPESGDFFVSPVEFMLKYGRLSDFYVQMDIGVLNLTRSHLVEKPIGTTTGTWHFSNVSLSAGTWYAVCMAAPTDICRMNVYLNNTNAVVGNTTEGSTSFLLENEDFWATVNLKSILLSAMWQGHTLVHIQHTFLGFFYSLTGTGMAHSTYVTPDGTVKEAFIVRMFGNVKVSEDSDFAPIFEPIWGMRGTWRFYTDLIGLNMATVNVLGADVVLPE